MPLTTLISKENLKKTAKVVALLAVGACAAYGINETGITQWMAEKQHWNQTFGLELGKEYLVPVGKWIYNSSAGLLCAAGTYAALNKLFK